MSLDAYLDGCSPERRDLFSRLNAMAAGLADRAEDLNDFVFVPGRPHPSWDDADAVFWLAVEQLMMPNLAAPDELPVLWVGYHVKDRLTRGREAQGFLLTSHRLIVKDSVDLVFTKGIARQYPLYEALVPSALISSVMEDYDWDTAGSLVDQEDADWIEQLLVDAVTSTVQILESHGHTLAAEPEATTNLRERVAELGLSENVKYADDSRHAKHFAKLLKKIALDPGEQVLAAFSDATLFGAYGLVLTDRALRSKDLGDDAISTPRADIDAPSVRLGSDSSHKIEVAGGQAHVVPAHLGPKQVEALLILVREWTVGQIN